VHNAYTHDQDCVGACHLKNYFFCYHLPTRGRAGVKHCFYISIIFYAPCLFLHHLLSVSLHFVAFLCIFRNQPINKMPHCQFPVLCYFCVSEKLHRKYSRNWTKLKPVVQIFHEASRTPKRRQSRIRGWPHHQGARPTPGPCRPMVWAPWSTSDDAPSPIKTSRWEKHKDPYHFSRTHRDPPPPSTQRSGGSRSSSRHPARDGNHHRRSSSWSCLPPAQWVSSLPWTMGL
jgi:hypothetical protein